MEYLEKHKLVEGEILKGIFFPQFTFEEEKNTVNWIFRSVCLNSQSMVKYWENTQHTRNFRHSKANMC